MNPQSASVSREILYGQQARKKLLEGVDAVANAVKVTMGAKGRTVFTSYGHATKDGVTVARDVELFDDKAAAHGARLVKEASVKTCDKAGDGTTTVCVLAQSLIREGIRKIGEGKDPQDLKAEMEACKATVLDALKAQQMPPGDLKEIASISANDETLGSIVAKAVEAVGVDGMVTVEKTYGPMEVEVADGMQLDRGLIPGPFLTDAQRRRAEYDDVSVLLFNGRLHDLHGFAKAVEPLVREGKALLIVANDYDEPVARSLQLTAIKGSGRLLPTNAVILYHDQTFQDLAAFTGATVMTESDGFKNFDPSFLGHAKKVIATPEKTTIQADESRKEAIAKQTEAIMEEAKNFTDAEKRNVEKRASRLNGRMAIVKLPETTEAEGKEIRDRVEDAIFASQAALEAGIVPGGGYAYLSASCALTGANDGERIVKTTLESPLRQIVRNAGHNDARVMEDCRALGSLFNVKTALFEASSNTKVVDPLKVALTAFENALSVALVALTTEVVISDKEIKR